MISVGGLSESVVTQSSKCLLRWIRACKSSRNLRAVAGLALRLVAMLEDARGDPRIVVPLLKTLEVCTYWCRSVCVCARVRVCVQFMV